MNDLAIATAEPSILSQLTKVGYYSSRTMPKGVFVRQYPSTAAIIGKPRGDLNYPVDTLHPTSINNFLPSLQEGNPNSA